MHSQRPIWFVLLLFLATSAEAATEYLIVTDEALSAPFQQLADRRAMQGLSTQLLTVEAIQAASTPGRDLAEQIRGAIQAVHAQGSLRFVLLGGDTSIIPPRFTENVYYPSDGPLPSDFYYAALDGDWDSDGDDLFAELGQDTIDLEPELALGRAPVRDATEAAQFVAKLQAYEDPGHATHLHSALLFDEVLFPSQWQPGQPISLDGATFGEEVAGILSGAGEPFALTKLYENHTPYPGALPLSKAQTLAQLGSGAHGWVVQSGHGYVDAMSVADGTLDSADAMALGNGSELFVLVSFISHGAAIEQDALLEAFVRNPNGGAIASLGMSRTSFPALTQSYVMGLHQALFEADGATLGEAMQQLLLDRSGSAQADAGARYAQLSFTLLGDPVIGVGAEATVTRTPPALAAALRLSPVQPNPFNPAARIRFELRGVGTGLHAVDVAVFDLAGRRVRSLWAAPLGEGSHELRWDGRDDAGDMLASGSYFAAVSALGRRRAVKMVMLK